MTASVSEQRRKALRARRALGSARARRASRQACARIARLALFTRARRIGLYWPLPSEADPRPLLGHLHPQQAAFLPRVEGDHLVFIRVTGDGFRHQRSAFGVVEPRGGRSRSVVALDLLVMPLAGFDAAARRIGLGGGFYDRTLAPCRRAGAYRGPRLVGLAFEAQRLDAIATRHWDVDLDAVVSEARVYRPASAPAGIR